MTIYFLHVHIFVINIICNSLCTIVVVCQLIEVVYGSFAILYENLTTVNQRDFSFFFAYLINETFHIFCKIKLYSARNFMFYHK